MIITHTQSQDGHRRIYLGAKLSIECWIEPAEDAKAWTFHYDAANLSQPISPADLRAWAAATLMALCDVLNVTPENLAAVPFEIIAALHTAPTSHHRRVPTPRGLDYRSGYMSTPPHVTRPATDFRARDFDDRERQRRR